MAFNIYTWGDSDTLAVILNSISRVFDNGDVQLFMTILVIATGAIALTKAFIFGKDVWNSIFMFFVGTMAFLIFFTKIKYDANIINERTGSASVVSSVPAPVVLTAHFFSTFEKVLMDVISSNFQTPSGINYENSGYNYGAALFASLPKLNISDPYFRRSFYEFVYSCFFEDILRGNKDFQTLSTTTDIWGYLRPVANVSTYYYEVSDPSGTLYSCSDIYNFLDSAFSSYGPTQINNVLSSLLGVNVSGSSLMPNTFQDFIGQPTSNSAMEVFKNTISARYIFDTLQYAASDSLVSSDVRSYAEQVAKNNIFRGWEIGGNNAREILPVVKSIIQLMLFAFFPFLLMMIFTPMRWMYIKMFLLLFFWLSLWDPLYAVATYVSNLRLEHLLSGVSYGQGYTLATMGKIFEQSMAHLTVWNYFAVVVPMLAFALAKASEHAMVSFAGNIASSLASGGASVGAQTASPQGAGQLMGQAQEVSKYGSASAFNRVADSTLFNAEKNLGAVMANRVASSIDSGVITRSAMNKEMVDVSHGSSLEDPMDIGTAKAIRDGLMSNRVKEGIKQFSGDVNKYVASLAQEGAVRDVSQAKALLNSIDKVFGNGDGKLTEDEIDNYTDFVKNKAAFDNKEAAEKLGDLMNLFKEQGYKNDAALMQAATFIGKGEAAKKLMHSIENKANLGALMKVADNDLIKAQNILKRAKTVDFSKMEGKTDELVKAGREVLGEEAKDMSNMEVLDKLGKVFGVNDAQKQMFENAKWESFAKELVSSKDKDEFYSKLNEFAELEGSLDASAKKGLMVAAKSVGLDKIKDMVANKTAGNFFKDIVEGIKNKDVIKSLGEGNYEKGLQRYSKLLAEKESGEAQKVESYLNNLADYYQKQDKNLSRAEAIGKAYKDLGTVNAYTDEGKLNALNILGGELQKAIASNNLAGFSQGLGYYLQSGGSWNEIEKLSKEKGMHELAHANALYELSGLLEKAGLSEKESNDVYQMLKEGSGMLHHLSSLGKIGALLGATYLTKKFGERAIEKFKGIQNLESLKNPKGVMPPSHLTSDTVSQRIMNHAKNTALNLIDSERSALKGKIQAGVLTNNEMDVLKEARSKGYTLTEKLGKEAERLGNRIDILNEMMEGNDLSEAKKAELKNRADGLTERKKFLEKLDSIKSKLEGAGVSDFASIDRSVDRLEKLNAQRGLISDLSMGNNKDVEKFMKITEGDSFKELFGENFDFKKAVKDSFMETSIKVKEGYENIFKNIKDEMIKNGASQSMIERFDDLYKRIESHPEDLGARKELAKFIDEDLIKGGYLSNKDLNNAFEKGISSVENKEAQAIIRDSSKVFSTAKGTAAKWGMRLAKGFAAFSNPFSLTFTVLDIGVGLATGESITERALNLLLSYRTTDRADTHIADLSRNISSFYGSKAGEQFIMAAPVSAITPFNRIGSSLGYNIDNPNDKAEFDARYADALYSYINENIIEYRKNDGSIDISRAARNLNHVLTSQNAEGHDKYIKYLKGDDNVDLIHPGSKGENEYLNHYFGKKY